MTERVATTPGLFPLPDAAKEELSDLKGHQKHDLISGTGGRRDRRRIQDVSSRSTRRTAVGRSRPHFVEGQLRWDDMLAHPLTTHANVDAKGIVRYYDNNNFYRDPVVEGELTFSGDVADELEAASETVDSSSLQAVLPGPYSLFDLATDEHYGDEHDFFEAIAEFLGGEVDAFPEHETLFLLEPSLVENAPDEDLQEQLAEAVDTVAARPQPTWSSTPTSARSTRKPTRI